MSMRCKQCAESFPSNQPFDVFELRRSGAGGSAVPGADQK